MVLLKVLLKSINNMFKDTFDYNYYAKQIISYMILNKLIDKAMKLASDYYAKNPNLSKDVIMNRALIIVYSDSKADNIHKDMIKFYNNEFKYERRNNK